jgi:hypothetical protein
VTPPSQGVREPSPSHETPTIKGILRSSTPIARHHARGAEAGQPPRFTLTTSPGETAPSRCPPSKLHQGPTPPRSPVKSPASAGLSQIQFGVRGRSGSSEVQPSHQHRATRGGKLSAVLPFVGFHDGSREGARVLSSRRSERNPVRVQSLGEVIEFVPRVVRVLLLRARIAQRSPRRCPPCFAQPTEKAPLPSPSLPLRGVIRVQLSETRPRPRPGCFDFHVPCSESPSGQRSHRVRHARCGRLCFHLSKQTPKARLHFDPTARTQRERALPRCHRQNSVRRHGRWNTAAGGLEGSSMYQRGNQFG